MREALRKLQSTGVVVLEPNRGAVVRGTSPHEVREAYLVRAELEGLAAELATAHITDEELGRLHEAQQLFRHSIEAEIEKRKSGAAAEPWSAENDWERANNIFHEVIQQAAGNRQLRATIAHLHRSFPRHLTWAALSRSSHLLGENIEQHNRILAAIERRDPPVARSRDGGARARGGRARRRAARTQPLNIGTLEPPTPRIWSVGRALVGAFVCALRHRHRLQARRRRTVLVAGVSVRVAGRLVRQRPHRLRAAIPMRLIAVSSAPLRPHGARGGFALAPAFRASARRSCSRTAFARTVQSVTFAVRRTSPLTGTACAGSSRAANRRQLLRICRYVKQEGRYVGFVVYPDRPHRRHDEERRRSGSSTA